MSQVIGIQENICPHCGQREIEWQDPEPGFCEECWEEYCDRSWWEAVVEIDKNNNQKKGEQKCID